ncbi:MAG TPA: hypothetical protein VGG72_35255 [Bryobacteraceae bacterium]
MKNPSAVDPASYAAVSEQERSKIGQAGNRAYIDQCARFIVGSPSLDESFELRPQASALADSGLAQQY